MHNSRAIDPQYAEIIPATRDIIYTFRLNEVQRRNLLMDELTEEKVLTMTKYITGGFAASLEIFCPKLEVMVGREYKENIRQRFGGYVHLGEIATMYTAKNSRELNQIQEYLMTIPTDDGMPKKEDTFFCYD